MHQLDPRRDPVRTGLRRRGNHGLWANVVLLTTDVEHPCFWLLPHVPGVSY